MAKLQRITKGLKLAHLAPEPPAIANFATGEVMGHSSDRLAAKFGVSREAMDKFALRSHQNAARATEEGIFKDEISPVDGHTTDNGIKGDSTLEKLYVFEREAREFLSCPSKSARIFIISLK